MDRILKYEKKILSILTMIYSILIIYIIIFLSQTIIDGNFTIIFTLNIFWHICSLIFYKLKYFNNKNIFILVKCIRLILLIPLLNTSNIFIISSAMLCYLLICIEIDLVLFHEFNSNKKMMIALVYIPVLIFLGYLKHIGQFDWDLLLMLFPFSVTIWGIYYIISENYEDLKVKILEQKELNDSLRQVTSEMYFQNELLGYISSTLDLQKLMNLVTDSIIGVIGVDTCSLIIHNFEISKYYFQSTSSHQEQASHALKQSLKKGHFVKYFSELQNIIDNDVDSSLYPFLEDRPVGSLIIIPLVNHSIVYGLLISEHNAKNFFEDNKIRFFQGITAQINIAVNNANLYTRMEDLTKKDSMTGLYNRKQLQIMINELISSKSFKHSVFSVVLFDLDMFKSINDKYGHLFGDEVIKFISSYAHRYANMNGGFAARYGGEEFVMIFPNRDISQTYNIIEIMHEELKNDPVLYDGKIPVYVNISVGITAFPEFGSTSDDLLRRADNAMYFSKELGRGRITTDSEFINKKI